jgi:hypothetical protein
VFSIANTSISFQTYDLDAGRSPQAQTFSSSQLLTGGYVFCSTAAVYVRLTVGFGGQERQLPEFFLPPGAQGVEVDTKSGGNPVKRIEVRAATATAAQFWGALSTKTDPIGGFVPASYSVSAGGVVIPPPAIGLTFQQDGVNKAFEQIADFVSLGGISWVISDDVPGTRALIPVPKNGFQVADAGQLNEVILDFQNAGGITWAIADDAANNRVKVTGTVASVLAYAENAGNTSVIVTTEATAVSCVSAGAVTFDGVTPVIIEYYCPDISNASAATIEVFMALYDGANSIGWTMDANFPATNGYKNGPIYWRRRLTPSAAAHTYSCRAWVSAAAGVNVQGGAGGSGNRMPQYIKITKDN